MLAAHHDQENVLKSHQMTGKPGSRQLAPKTPGPRYPKTPMKIPLNDENAPATGGKGLLGGGKNTVMKKQALATPMGTRQRAPLGNKTTNAKARAAPVPGGVKEKIQEIEQSQAKQASVQKPKPKHAGTAPAKLHVRNDEQEAGEPDIEYIPPRPTDLPYESDVFPDGVLTFEGLKPENLLRGYYERYHDPVEEDGVRRKDRLFEERLQKALKEGDERILRDIENTDWSVSDVPGAKQISEEQQKKLAHGSRPASAADTTRSSRIANRRPPTITSRRAASALSMASTQREKKPQVPLQIRKPRSFLPGRNVSMPIVPAKSRPEGVIAEAASRSTLGYSKGRSASSAVNAKRTVSRTPSTASVSSNGSDVTITPANFQKMQDAKLNRVDELSRPQFLSVFDAGEDSDDGGFGRNVDLNFEDDEEFQLKLDE
ncbi:uncharacterized protein DNG_03429 [Cephalotrichum gorgonifer]|uniref:Uncharacterized protein n=1 Tax=Cephalotrichum gorgonifer TaxID=2041049 RepID=A0AAE8MWJ1_9PEZI|nr:uncharacterized protein DNG_03429 [Cephalotrichum gorgonifer]